MNLANLPEIVLEFLYRKPSKPSIRQELTAARIAELESLVTYYRRVACYHGHPRQCQCSRCDASRNPSPAAIDTAIQTV